MIKLAIRKQEAQRKPLLVIVIVTSLENNSNMKPLSSLMILRMPATHEAQLALF